MYRKFCLNFIISVFVVLVITLFLIIFCDWLIKNLDFVISTMDDKNQQNVYYWFERKIDIAERKSLLGKKLVFLGGSSTLFGINTNVIENKYAIPVVNFGLHAGYPFLIFEYAKKILNNGDFVIIPLEYQLYEKNNIEFLKKGELQYIFLFDKNLYKNLNVKRKYQCVYYLITNIFGIRHEKYLKNLKNDFLENFESCYSTKYWNDNGDNKCIRVFDKNIMQKNILSSSVPMSNKVYNSEDLSYVNDKNSYLYKFIKFASKNNITVYFIAPVKLLSDNNDKKYYNIKDLWEYAGYNYIDNLDDCFYDKKYFYDTDYHLTNEGAQKRTEEIIHMLEMSNILRNFIQSRKAR